MPAVVQAGVDTWSPSWRVREDDNVARAMTALASQRGAAGSRMLPDAVAGYRVGWFPHACLVFAEGHAAPEGLGSPDKLPERLYGIEEALWDHGIQVEPAMYRRPMGRAWHLDHECPGDYRPGFAGVRRVDATVDISTDTPAEGLAMLAGVAALMYPRSKTAAWRSSGSGHIETVMIYGHAGRKVLGRWYDKGIESGTAPRGMLIRPEDQRRFPSRGRRGVEELTSGYVRDKFRQRFEPLWKASKGITVGGLPVIVGQLQELVTEGDITPRKAEMLAGHVVLSSNGLELGAESTLRRRRAELREHGLVVADESMTEVEVNLHDVLGEALESPHWGAHG